MQYVSDLASQEYGNAFNRMTNARDYTEGVRRYDDVRRESPAIHAGLGEISGNSMKARAAGASTHQNVATSDRDFNGACAGTT